MFKRRMALSCNAFRSAPPVGCLTAPRIVGQKSMGIGSAGCLRYPTHTVKPVLVANQFGSTGQSTPSVRRTDFDESQ